MVILEVFSSGPALTNCILLACPKTHEGAIIDAPFDVSQQLLERIEALKISITMLLITHSHWDHIAEIAFLKNALPHASIYIHRADEPNLRTPGVDGLPMICEVKGILPDSNLTNGQKLQLGELLIEVIHTPGHSPGSVCFFLQKEKILLSGDTLFKGTIGNISFPTSDPNQMWLSLERLAKLPSDTRVIPGHGKETTIGQEQWLSNARAYFE